MNKGQLPISAVMCAGSVDYSVAVLRGCRVVTVQCPRLAQHQEFVWWDGLPGVVEFSGVCVTVIPDAGFCSTTLRLSVTAHVFAWTPADI